MSEKSITVPETLLQDLLWNIELNYAGEQLTSKMEEAIVRQAKELQAILTPDSYVDPYEGFTLEDMGNVEFVDFGKRARS